MFVFNNMYIKLNNMHINVKQLWFMLKAFVLNNMYIVFNNIHIKVQLSDNEK